MVWRLSTRVAAGAGRGREARSSVPGEPGAGWYLRAAHVPVGTGTRRPRHGARHDVPARGVAVAPADVDELHEPRVVAGAGAADRVGDRPGLAHGRMDTRVDRRAFVRRPRHVAPAGRGGGRAG